MKIYLFITKKKRQYAMYKAYIETLQQRLDIADNIEDADVVLFLGAGHTRDSDWHNVPERWESHTSFVHWATSRRETAIILA